MTVLMTRQTALRGTMALGLAGLMALSACGPVPVAVAEQQCYDIAQRTRPISGEAKFGFNQDGAIYDIDTTVSLGNLTGQDPNEVYARCVYQKSGQLPTRPLYSR
ncbi:hypothetical protein [Pseudothioclava nitratireducens]|jgi:hypothetical protein|uniref:hypothetical protein n=1 Tax=Pseudothioclava nitratireducens TaxID=1928646 RepID=UPI0023DA89AD|nr:hypothetical protein [Defluviimonas nitratireducens]MDF1619164.1 hypothetical protein [Defluviimonas nitratireducens]